MFNSTILKRSFYLVFESLFSSAEAVEESIQDEEVETRDRNPEAVELARKVWANRAELDAVIESKLTGQWKLNRLGKVDLALLLVGAEVLAGESKADKNDHTRIIRELGDMAAEWGATDRSANFVTGVLNAVAAESQSSKSDE